MESTANVIIVILIVLSSHLFVAKFFYTRGKLNSDTEALNKVYENNLKLLSMLEELHTQTEVTEDLVKKIRTLQIGENN